MLYRNIRDKATGQWVNVVFTKEGDRFNVKATTHRASVADALGVNRTSLEVIDSDSDQRSGVLIEQGPPPEQPQTREEVAADALVDELGTVISMTDTQKASLKGRVLALAEVT